MIEVQPIIASHPFSPGIGLRIRHVTQHSLSKSFSGIHSVGIRSEHLSEGAKMG